MGPETSLLRHPLSYVRQQRGWSAVELLARVADVAEAHLRLRLPRGDAGKVARWETRGVTPEAAVQRALARSLGIPASRLAQAPWPRWLPAFDGVRVVPGWSPAAAVSAMGDALPATGPDRRAYLALAGPPLIAVAQRWLDRRPPPLLALVRGRPRPDEAVLAGLDQQVRILRAVETLMAPEPVGRLAAAHARLILELLTTGSYDVRAATRLYRAAARHLTIAGWAAFDTGRHFDAQRYFRAALHAAQVTGDRGSGAYLLTCLAYQAVTLGHVAAGLRVADAATATLPSGEQRDLLAAYRGLTLIAAGRDPAAVARAVRSRGRHRTGRVPAPAADGWPGWLQPRGDGPSEQRYLLLDGGARAVAVLGAHRRTVPAATGGGEIAQPAGAEPARCRPSGRTHLELHRLATQLAAARSPVENVRDGLRALGEHPAA